MGRKKLAMRDRDGAVKTRKLVVDLLNTLNGLQQSTLYLARVANHLWKNSNAFLLTQEFVTNVTTKPANEVQTVVEHLAILRMLDGATSTLLWSVQTLMKQVHEVKNDIGNQEKMLEMFTEHLIPDFTKIEEEHQKLIPVFLVFKPYLPILKDHIGDAFATDFEKIITSGERTLLKEDASSLNDVAPMVKKYLDPAFVQECIKRSIEEAGEVDEEDTEVNDLDAKTEEPTASPNLEATESSPETV